MNRSVLWLSALVVGAVATLPPMHGLAHDSFAWHMGQHLVLIFAVAPLIAYALPARPPVGNMRLFLAPAVVAIVQIVVLWAWHLPILYDAALRTQPLHAIEHASFVVTAVAFWYVVAGRSRSVDHLRRTAVVFVTGLASAALGAVITFASQPLYESHLKTTQQHGMTPLEDQQLAGGIMWIPPGVVYLVLTLALFLAWMKGSDVAAEEAPT